ncbi:uncharacterized protein TNCV_1888511 [Trichonephila clavipes]|nr:uncharacterized protein TNCV_1888511 [Trichonephila clavipes]
MLKRELVNISFQCLAARVLLATGVIILNHGQVTKTTPELTPPLLAFTPTGGCLSLERFNNLHGGSSVILGPVPLKTHRVGQRRTLNLSRAETSSLCCGVVVRRGGVPAQVSSASLDHGSKLRGPSPKALV